MENAIRDLTEAIKNTSNINIIDILTISISLLALFFSLFDIIHQNKVNKANLQADYYKEIFGDYLKQSIPEKAKSIGYTVDGKLNKNYRLLTKVLFEMVRKSGYFQYTNTDFYIELKDKVKEFDEFMVESAGEIITDSELQNKKLIEINKLLCDIYQIINTHYQDI